MAVYRVWNGGTNIGGAGGSWTDAYTTMASVLLVPPVTGDTILVHYAHQQETASGASLTVTIPAGVSVIAVDKDNADVYRPMGADGWLQATNGTLIFSQLAGAYVAGITIRNATGATSSRIITHRGTNDQEVVAKDMYYWHHGVSSARFSISVESDFKMAMRLINPTFRFGNTGQQALVAGRIEIIGGRVSSDGSAVTTIFAPSTTSDASGGQLQLYGFDATAASNSATLIGGTGVIPLETVWTQCKLPSSHIMVSSDGVGRAGSTVELRQCYSNSEESIWAYANTLGSVVLDETITYEGVVAWSIWTNSNVTPATPFVTPWIVWDDKPTVSCTPYFEFAKQYPATPYTNAEVSSQWITRDSSGMRFLSDAVLPWASPVDLQAGSGLEDWTGGGLYWSGKTTTGEAITPIAGYDLMGRIVVSRPSQYVLLSPVIRT